MFNRAVETNSLIVCFGNNTMWKAGEGREKKKKSSTSCSNACLSCASYIPGQDHTMVIPVWDTLKHGQKLVIETCSGKSQSIMRYLSNVNLGLTLLTL